MFPGFNCALVIKWKNTPVLWVRRNCVFLQAIQTAMQTKLTEILYSLRRNKKEFKINCIIPLNFLWALDNMAPFRKKKKNEICTCKTLFLFWPPGKFWATFR